MDDDAIRDSQTFPAPERLGAPAPRAPEATPAWLHVVSGPSTPALSRAVFELSARFLARGERVLLVDAAPRLRLHERFDRESRWGVLDCLGGTLPLLGLVQDAGRLGLYLLAHGASEAPADWSRLGPVLDEARRHFARAILALDPDAPEVIGKALSGIHLEGWWPAGAREARRSAGVGGRLGIQFSDLGLDAMLSPRLEALDERIWALAAPPVPAEEAAATAAAPEAATAPATPVVLEGEPEVRERLRHLLWSRRSERDEAVETAAAPPDESRSA